VVLKERLSLDAVDHLDRPLVGLPAGVGVGSDEDLIWVGPIGQLPRDRVDSCSVTVEVAVDFDLERPESRLEGVDDVRGHCLPPGSAPEGE